MATVYVVGDNLTIQCPLTLLSTGAAPDLTGATMTILVTTPAGVETRLTATQGTAGTIQAAYIATVAGVYRVEPRVVLSDGTKLTGQPVGAFTAVAALF